MHLLRSGHRAYAALVALTLTLAVGANLLVFTVVDALWLKPRPVARPDQVVVISNLPVGGDSPIDMLRAPMLEDFRRSGVFESVAGQVATGMGDFRPRLVMSRVGHPVETLAVTAQYFSVLGLPIRGRDFSVADDDIGAAPVAVISDALWRHAFGAAPDVIGQTLSTSHLPIQVIGVAPPGFGGARLGEHVDLWIPHHLVLQVSASAPAFAAMTNPGSIEQMLPLVGLARLRPGVTSADASRALARTADQDHLRASSGLPRVRLTVQPLKDVFGTPDRPTVIVREPTVVRILAVTAVLVLIGGCMTLMALVLVHYERRRQELAVRLALGASRAQLARLLGLELIGLAIIGAAGAIVVDAWAFRIIPSLSLPGGIDLGRLELGVDWRVATVGILAAAGALGVAAAIPIRRFSGANLVMGLVSPTTVGALTSLRLRRGMLALHVAATLVVLVAAGLFLRTVAYGFGRGPGFDVERTAFISLQPSVAEFFDATEGPDRPGAEARKARAYAHLLDGLAALPGVEAVARGSAPLRPDVTAPIPPRPVTANSITRQMAVLVSRDPPGYLAAMGVPLVAGRELTAGDVATAGLRPAIITASFASTLWPSDTPLGRRFALAAVGYDVIGVVPDVACDSLRSEMCGRIFAAAPAALSTQGLGVDITLRARDDAGTLVEPARRLAAAIFPNASRLDVQTGRDLVALDLGQERLGVWFFSGFGLVVLALGLGGVFGLVAYLAESKRREFGLRMALGATHGRVLRSVMVAGLSPVIVGTSAGLVAATVLAHSIDALLLGVTPLDPATYVSAAGLMMTGALAGSLLAAWRIHRQSPMEALRAE